MVRVDVEQMRRRRQQLGWTAEELAERSGLDARTIRRMEHGAAIRLHSAHAFAHALAADTSAFLVNDESSLRSPFRWDDKTSEAKRDAVERKPAAASKGPEYGSQTELACEGEQGANEVMYVSSLLLTRALAMEGKGPAEQEDDGVYGVVTAFRAADVVIRTMLSGRGVLDFDEVTRVLSLLLVRYARAYGRQPGSDFLAEIRMVDAVSKEARATLADPVTPGYPDGILNLGEPPEPLLGEEGDIKLGKTVILRRPSR